MSGEASRGASWSGFGHKASGEQGSGGPASAPAEEKTEPAGWSPNDCSSSPSSITLTFGQALSLSARAKPPRLKLKAWINFLYPDHAASRPRFAAGARPALNRKWLPGTTFPARGRPGEPCRPRAALATAPVVSPPPGPTSARRLAMALTNPLSRQMSHRQSAGASLMGPTCTYRARSPRPGLRLRRRPRRRGAQDGQEQARVEVGDPAKVAPPGS